MTRTTILSEATIRQLAAELHASEKSGVQVEHFSRRFPGMGIADGYAIARTWVQLKVAAGRRVCGHKIGLTSRAMQQASQITEPDFGALLDDMFFEPGDIPFDRFIAPRVEVELAFVLKTALSSQPVTIADVLEATDHLRLAIEIIDARIEQRDRYTGAMRTVYDTISDNAANAGVILGGDRIDPHVVDLPWVGAVLRRNGVVEETGLAAGVQGHPAVGVAWLADRLAPWQETLLPGQVVLAGSFTRPVPARRGDHFDADYGPLGRFQFTFV